MTCGLSEVTLSRCQNWDKNPRMSCSHTRVFCCCFRLSQSPTRQDGNIKADTSLPLCPTPTSSDFSCTRSSCFSAFHCFSASKTGASPLLKLPALREPSSDHSEEVITYLNCGLDVDKWVGKQWDKGEVTPKGRDKDQPD